MPAASTTICLSMIVKNEAHVLRRCLASVLPLIQSWIIVDTGSTDGTQDLVREVLGHLPGEVIERPWKDFGHNRSEALELARERGRADYSIVIDADDVFENVSSGPCVAALSNLTADAYSLTVNDHGKSYRRIHLFKSTRAWRYVGVVHEIAECTDAGPIVHLDESNITYRRLGGGARSQATTAVVAPAHDKFRRDALLLEAALREDPSNARHTFYLAQSYRDLGDVDRAMNWYQRRAKLGGWSEEVYFSLLQIGRLLEKQKAPAANITSAYLAAYNARPERAESMSDLARYHRRLDNHTLAYLFAQAAVATPRPDDALFVDEEIYAWRRFEELALAAAHVGDMNTARAATERMLGEETLPEAVRERALENLETLNRAAQGSP